MKIGHEEVAHVARLSQLMLSESEAEQMLTSLREILENMQILAELTPIPNVPASDASDTAPSPTSAAWIREDVVLPSSERSALLANAPVANGESLIVPKSVE